MKHKETEGKKGDRFLNYLLIKSKDINAEDTGFKTNNLKDHDLTPNFDTNFLVVHFMMLFTWAAVSRIQPTLHFHWKET